MFLSSFSPIHQSAALPDDEGEQVAGYTLGPIVGYGGFSTIRKASSSQGGIVAVKIVRRSDVTKQPDPERARQMLDHEMQVWSSLGHEHILPLFTSSHTSYADFFVTLYCPAGSLFDILKRDGRPALPQDDAGMMFRQVVRGLRYLHESAGIVHGDMKLENVLVDEMGVCKIGDFGMARKIGEFDQANGLPAVAEVVEVEEVRHHREGRGIQRFATMREKSNRSRSRTGAPLPLHMSLLRHHSGPRHRNSNPLPDPAEVTHIFPNPTFQPGSLPYAAPELLLPQSEAPSVPRPNPAQDIWALGIMLYALLTGRLPFVDSFEPRLQMKILHGVYTVPQGVGRGAERVLKGCLERSIPNRWTIEMVDEVAWGIGWGTEGDDVSFSPE
ncbi:kinase-like domain-containing protein, partial [Cristinia sonorae]